MGVEPWPLITAPGRPTAVVQQELPEYQHPFIASTIDNMLRIRTSNEPCALKISVCPADAKHRHDQEMRASAPACERTGSGRGEPSRNRKSTTSRWPCAAREGPNNFTNTSSSSVDFPSPEGMMVSQEHIIKFWSGGGLSGNEEIPRSNYREISQGRAKTVHALRRSSSEASSGSGTSCGSTGCSSVTTSDNPEVLKGEIRRLQAALMNGFKGGNRFVGGAQFKASARKQAPGNNCGTCLQAREALRRSRVDSRDLRGSLVRAEAVIKQLTLTKGIHPRAQHKSLFGEAFERACGTAAGDSERVLNACSYSLGGQDDREIRTCRTKSRNGELENIDTSSRADLIARVRKLEQELRLADMRHSQSMGAVVSADHGLKDALAEVSSTISCPCW